MRKFLAFLLVLGVLVVGADFLAGRAFESRTRQVVKERFELQQEPVVQVRDFPFLLSVARGRLGTVDVAAESVDAGAFTLEQLQLNLADVRFSRGLLLNRPGTITVDQARGQVRITQEEVNRLVAEQTNGATVEIAGDGVTVEGTIEAGILPQPVPVSVAGELTVREGRIVFVPQDVDAGGFQLPPSVLDNLNQQITYRLPELPGGMIPDRVTTEAGALVIGGHVDDFSVRAN